MISARQFRTLTKEEKLLWEAVLKTVIPLEEEKTTPIYEKPLKIEKIAPSSLKQLPLPYPLKNSARADSIPIPSIEKHWARKLKTNKLSFSAILDLHGLSQDLAYEKLKTFIFDNAAKNRRCLLIITGKGKGILRKSILNWLHEEKFRPLISALEQSHPHHGGEGAFYVILKKKKHF